MKAHIASEGGISQPTARPARGPPHQPIGGELRQYPQNNVSPIQNISSLCKYLDFTQCKYLISIAAMLFPQLSDVTSILSVCIERETSLFF